MPRLRAVKIRWPLSETSGTSEQREERKEGRNGAIEQCFVLYLLYGIEEGGGQTQMKSGVKEGEEEVGRGGKRGEKKGLVG